jgi:ketosteroid isomerase-like protein
VEATVSNSEGIALLRHVFDWLNDHDVDAFLGALHPDCEARPSIAGDAVLRGRAEVRAWLDQFADGELEVRPLDFEERDGCILVRGYLRRRSGRTLAENEVYWLCEVRDGQVRRIDSHLSRRAALAAC